MKLLNVKLFVLVFLLIPKMVYAENTFNLEVVVNGTSYKTSYSNVEEAIHVLEGQSIESITNNTYTETSAVAVNLDYRGLPFNLSYADNGTALTVNIQGIPAQQFNCDTRACSVDLFVDWLKKNENGFSDLIFKQLAAVSPIDPLAGNQSSLTTQMTEDIASGSMFSSAVMGTQSGDESPTDNYWGTELEYSSYDTVYGKVVRLRVPISYTLKFDGDPRQDITIRAPVTQTKVSESVTYALPVSMIYRYPVTDNWVLLPALTAGATYSEDLGGGGTMGGYSLTSSYSWHLGNKIITMGNMVGSIESLSTQFGDYSLNPGIKETIYKNGFLVTLPRVLFHRYLLELSAVNTQMSGVDLYVNEYNSFGLTISKDRSETGRRNRWAFGVRYITSEVQDSYDFSVSYWF